jgi:hypothetical protein
MGDQVFGKANARWIANLHLPARHIVPAFAGAITKVTLEFAAELPCTFVSNMDGCLTYADLLLQ